MFVIIKWIIKTRLTSTYKSIIHQIASWSEKVVLSESGEKNAQIKHRLLAKTGISKYVAGIYRTTGDGCFKCFYGLLAQRFDVKIPKCCICFLLHKTLTGVYYCDVLISCLDCHFDGTHSLQSIHCWDDAMIHFSKSDEETNSSSSWMVWERV